MKNVAAQVAAGVAFDQAMEMAGLNGLEADEESEVGWRIRLPKGITKKVSRTLSKIDYKKAMKNVAAQVAAGVAFDQAMEMAGLNGLEADEESEVGWRIRLPKGIT